MAAGRGKLQLDGSMECGAEAGRSAEPGACTQQGGRGVELRWAGCGYVGFVGAWSVGWGQQEPEPSVFTQGSCTWWQGAEPAFWLHCAGWCTSPGSSVSHEEPHKLEAGWPGFNPSHHVQLLKLAGGKHCQVAVPVQAMSTPRTRHWLLLSAVAQAVHHKEGVQWVPTPRPFLTPH